MNAPEYSHSEEFVSGKVIVGPQLFRQDLWFCCYEKVIYTWKSLIKLFWDSKVDDVSYHVGGIKKVNKV